MPECYNEGMFVVSKLHFEKLTLSHIPLIHSWLNEPHVHEWYDKDKENTFDEVEKEYAKYVSGEDPTHGFIVSYDNQQVAYIQWYNILDWPELREAVQTQAGTVGVDVFIGEKEFLGKGFGSFMLKQFLRQIVFVEEGVTTCIIDPEPANVRAIKAYENVGFVYTQTVEIPGEPAPSYLMEIHKEELAEG